MKFNLILNSNNVNDVFVGLELMLLLLQFLPELGMMPLLMVKRESNDKLDKKCGYLCTKSLHLKFR